MRMLQTGTAALFSLAALLVAVASEAGEITVMSTVAVREPYLELVPAFERATENKVATIWVGVSSLVARPGIVDCDPGGAGEPGAQHIARLVEEAILVGDQQAHELSLGIRMPNECNSANSRGIVTCP